MEKSSQETKITRHLENVSLANLFGPNDQLLTIFEKLHSEITTFVRGNQITLKGPKDSVSMADDHLNILLRLLERNESIDEDAIKTTFYELKSNKTEQLSKDASNILTVRGRSIRPQTKGQRAYTSAIDQNTITFGIGPAGTGKTFLAVAKAVAALQNREVAKIILTRPAVEAGERLGYLPGTLSEKIDPYLRPLFDAAASMLDPETVTQLLSSGAIEVAPLAYMRGRTLNESFVILDEAQNATAEQMKMFLTRLGYGSKIVVTGDLTQADLPKGVSGLHKVTKILKDVDDISFQYLTTDDIVRHSLVGKIVDAYDSFEESK